VQKASEADALLTWLTDPIDSAVLASPTLKVVSQCSIGTDNIDLDFATSRRLPITHTPGCLTEACADLAWSLLLAAARLIVPAARYVLDDQWTGSLSSLFLGRDIFSKTLGIVGPGRIGQAVARRAVGFSMRVIYFGPHTKPDFETSGAQFRTLDELLSESDFVVLTCPLTAATRGLITIAKLRLMKKTAILVNMARGPVVITDDLVTALREGVIGGAALDVTDPEPIRADHPLLKCQNCLVIPHIGSATVETRGTMSRLAAEGIIDVLSGKRPRHCANAAIFETE
jgi:phosphoglycerate dehydrogenase-like enzyme